MQGRWPQGIRQEGRAGPATEGVLPRVRTGLRQRRFGDDGGSGAGVRSRPGGRVRVHVGRRPARRVPGAVHRRRRDAQGPDRPTESRQSVRGGRPLRDVSPVRRRVPDHRQNTGEGRGEVRRGREQRGPEARTRGAEGAGRDGAQVRGRDRDVDRNGAGEVHGGRCAERDGRRAPEARGRSVRGPSEIRDGVRILRRRREWSRRLRRPLQPYRHRVHRHHDRELPHESPIPRRRGQPRPRLGQSQHGDGPAVVPEAEPAEPAGPREGQVQDSEGLHVESREQPHRRRLRPAGAATAGVHDELQVHDRGLRGRRRLSFENGPRHVRLHPGEGRRWRVSARVGLLQGRPSQAHAQGRVRVRAAQGQDAQLLHRVRQDSSRPLHGLGRVER
mmetsp:Transcript_23625/g.43639  ORF Transcript_23625/g.43639 Transcript_23625/m.43639 type:complete len:388 (+) Transcript_23625:109-1272(+)